MNSVYEAAKKYAQMQIETSAAPKVICMLHAKCCSLIKQGVRNEEKKRRGCFDHAQNILAQLERSLVIEDDLSKSLYCLYDYCYCLLEKVHVENGVNALKILIVLKDTFEELFKKR